MRRNNNFNKFIPLSYGVLVSLIFMLTGRAADLYSTWVFLQFNLSEGNPIWAYIITNYGFTYVILANIILLAIIYSIATHMIVNHGWHPYYWFYMHCIGIGMISIIVAICNLMGVIYAIY